LLVNCGDPAIFSDNSITEPVFTVHQEYNSLNNATGITDPTSFKEVRDFCKKVQLIQDTTDAQKRGTADITTALADVKPKVHVFISNLIFNFSLCMYASSPSVLARQSNLRQLLMTRMMMKLKLSEVT